MNAPLNRLDGDFRADRFRARIRTLTDGNALWNRAVGLATERFLKTLSERNALPHSVLGARLAEFCELDRSSIETIACCLDGIQVAIDVADDIADYPRDSLDPSREVHPASLLPTLVCLPAVLIGEITRRLSTEFERGPDAARRVLAILSRMGAGQSMHGQERIRSISAEQGRLLCLPLWIAESTKTKDIESSIEAWAFALGDTWERSERVRESASSEARMSYRNALLRLRRAWPEFSPFGSGESLGPEFFGVHVDHF